MLIVLIAGGNHTLERRGYANHFWLRITHQERRKAQGPRKIGVGLQQC